MQDYDRDPEALTTLDAKVWVLSSSLQIMPHKEQGENEFMRKVKDIITITGGCKSTCGGLDPKLITVWLDMILTVIIC